MEPSRPNERSAGELRDRRVLPQCVVPRRVQTWMMAGLSLVIITVILLTGRQEPAAPTQPVGLVPSLPAPERIQTFRDELGSGSVVLEASQAPESATPMDSPAAGPPADDALVQERRRREYESLFATNVAYSTRQGARSVVASPRDVESAPASLAMPTPEQLAAFQQALSGGAQPAPLGPAPTAPNEPESAREVVAERQLPDGLRIAEGTVVEAVLVNRLDGTFSGPVTSLVTTPVYSEDRQSVLIPAGARLLGLAEPVDGWGDARLAVSFHRLLLPNGQSVELDQFRGLNQVGETGLKDEVDRHYLQVFGASVAIGALSGLAQWNTRGFTGDFGDASRQSAGASLATSSGRVLDRYLNVLPTVTIREGHRLKVYLTNDLYVPAYARVDDAGGMS